MSEWRTTPPTEAEVPQTATCWVTTHDGDTRLSSGYCIRHLWGKDYIAWQPIPDPYVPPKSVPPCPACGAEMRLHDGRNSDGNYWYQCSKGNHWCSPIKRTLDAAYAEAARVLGAVERVKVLEERWRRLQDIFEYDGGFSIVRTEWVFAKMRELEADDDR